MKAVEQASAENLLGGFIVVGGNVGFDILLPVFGLQPSHCDITLHMLRMTNDADKKIKNKKEGGKVGGTTQREEKGLDEDNDRSREGGEKLLVDGGGLVDGKQLKSTRLG